MSLDLFTPAISDTQFHPAFATLLNQATEADKNVLSEWSKEFVDRDGKFVKEFQTSFDSSFWELYLFAVLKKLGMKCDFQFSRPDFCVLAPQRFAIEATVSLHAKGTPSVLDTDHSQTPKDYADFNRQAIIRLSNSIHAKYKKYVESYSVLPHVQDVPFVLAIAPFDRPHFQMQAQRPVEALLYRSYVDEDSYLLKHPNRDAPLEPCDLPSVTKDNGETLPLGLFCDANMAGLSAVIQSSSATWSKVRALSRDPDVSIEAIYEDRIEGGIWFYRGPNTYYNESLLDGLRIYHNPYATHPLDPRLFNREEVFQASATGPVQLTIVSGGVRGLASRKAVTWPQGLMQAVAEQSSSKNYWHFIPPHGPLPQ